MSTQSFSIPITFLVSMNNSHPCTLDQTRSPPPSKINRVSRLGLSRPKSQIPKARRTEIAGSTSTRSVSNPLIASPTYDQSIAAIPRTSDAFSASTGSSTPRTSPRTPKLRHSKSTSHFESGLFPGASQTPGLPAVWLKGKLRAHIVASIVSESIDLNILDDEGNTFFQHVANLSTPWPPSLLVNRVHPSIVPYPNTLALRASDMHTVLVAFESAHAASEWLCLMRVMVPRDNGHVDRRVHIDILDLEEASSSTSPRAGLDESKSMSHMPSQASVASGTEASRAGSPTPRSKAGWSHRYKLAAKLFLDDVLMLRTAAVRAEAGQRPYWGTSYHLEDISAFSSCVLRLYRLRKARFEHFATVTLPLVCDFQSRQDERYPIISLDGAVLGEIRLAVSYYESSCWSQDVKILTHLDLSAGLDDIYRMNKLNMLRGTSYFLSRIGFATGTLIQRLVNMSERESSSSPETLFRGNTPLTKNLESSMRFLCFNFLMATIGPTVRRISAAEVALTDDDLFRVTHECWDSIYTHRHLFPIPLRKVFASLRAFLRKKQPEETALPSRAVASFVFLRLINPALMQPQLYDLVDAQPHSQAQRHLKLAAKVLHNIAFPVEGAVERDTDLASHAQFIRDHRETMSDFLLYVSTMASESMTLSDLGTYLAMRRHDIGLDERYFLPTPTRAGLVDVAADTAHLVSIMRQRILARGTGSPAVGSPPAETKMDYGVEDMTELQSLLFGSTHNDTAETAPPRTPVTDNRGSSGRPSLTLISTPSPGKPYASLREKMTSPNSAWFGRGKSSGRERSAAITAASVAAMSSRGSHGTGEDDLAEKPA